ncbi:hypothetical protein Tco_0034330 [Tanacetum coccineum]
MHQPWRTLATIINKCLSGKTSSNDRLRQSRVGILWGMFHRKNVNFTELIWEDFQYQIDYRQSKLRRCEIMPYPRFTKIIIYHFLSLHKSIPKGLSSGLNTIKDDGVIQRLKFMNKEAYQAFIAYSTCLIPPKKTGGKGSQGKKQTITQKKKSSISAEDNIIPEPDVALELGKSMITIKPTGVDESDREPANRLTGRRRPSGDTLNVSKKKSLDESQKLKGIQVMTEEEQLAADTKKAIKASKEAVRLQQRIEESSEVGITPEVQLTGIFTTSSEGAGMSRVPDKGKRRICEDVNSLMMNM